MMQEVAAAEGIDLLVLMVDQRHASPRRRAAVRKSETFSWENDSCAEQGRPLAKAKLLPLIDSFSKAFEFSAIVLFPR